MPPSVETSSLNPEQAAAVEYAGGPLVIFAGAGSGKTRVITYRIAHLIRSGVSAYRILAVTFTNKAARELKERLADLVGEDVRALWVGTFHSVCGRMLRMSGEAIGVDRSFVIFDDDDQIAVVKDLLKKKNLDDKSIQPRAVLSQISWAKERLYTPEQYAREATGFFERIVAEIFPKYQEVLAQNNGLDFDDMIQKAVELLEKSDLVREQYQERFLHCLVDEFQDVNPAQYKLIQLLGAKHRNITIVGDDDQSIYAWRGADVSLILRFSSDYPDAKVITLAQNYRSTQRILEAAYEVIRHNRSRAEKKLWTANDEGVPITVSETGTEQDEAMLVADTVAREVRSKRRDWKDFAILYRTNAQSRVMEEVFLTLRIPHILVGGVRFYERREIRDMIAYLRLVLNPRDEISLKRVINVPARGIGSTAIATLAEVAASMGISQFEAMSTQDFQNRLTRRTVEGVRTFVAIVQEAAEAAQRGQVTPVLRHVMNRSGYLEELREENSDESISRLENLQELLNVTGQYDQTAEEEPNLGEFLEQVALLSDADTLKNDGDAVTLMTLHSAKGLEFPVVYLVGLEEGVFPHSRSLTSESELEEERRLCYVGMTRARQELHMLHASRRAVFGQPSFNRRSRFLDDIPCELVSTLLPESTIAPRGLTQVRPNRGGEYAIVEPRRETPTRSTWKPPFNVGDRVRHAKFGLGVVISCNPVKNDAEVTVAFPGVTGVKKLLQSFAKLEAVT